MTSKNMIPTSNPSRFHYLLYTSTFLLCSIVLFSSAGFQNAFTNGKISPTISRIWSISQSTRIFLTKDDEFDVRNISVHFVRIYPTSAPNSPDHDLCFLECVALLSVLKHLQPENIMLHTNAPTFSPFSSCRTWITDLSMIKILPLVPNTSIGGKNITILHHQADIAKLKILREFGGVVMDMDVFVINGTFIREVLRNFTCMLSQEGSQMLNAGFAACRKGAKWPGILLEFYKKDYRKDWYYNSAVIPFRILRRNRALQRTVYVDDTISDNPEGKEGYKMLRMKGMVDWRRKVAFQSFYHNCRLGLGDLNGMDTGFGELLRWILHDT